MSDPRLRAAVLGATGAVGQKLVAHLEAHPWFQIAHLLASERSAGRPYGQAVHWLEPTPLPASLAETLVEPMEPPADCDVAFSALAADVARDVEPAFAAAGIHVVSNASAFRSHEDVPLLVPEINPAHLDLARRQRFGPGVIVTNPNCVVAGLVCALKPLDDAFGLERGHVTTLQAVSGAGYPGHPALDILGNAIPYIAGEEEKIESEPRRILGRLVDDRVEPASFRLSVQATRVPVVDGHLMTVSLGLRRRASVVDVREALAGFVPARSDLPSTPRRLLKVFDAPFLPQPRLHANLGGGMTVSVGRVRECPLLDVRFVVLVHNTVRGAAGGALLNAELLVREGFLGDTGTQHSSRRRLAGP